MGLLVFQWLVGLTISLGIGHIVTHFSLKWLRSYIGIQKDDYLSSKFKGVPGWLIGLIERLFFTFIIAFDVSGSATAMIVWVATKMLSGWHRTGIGDKLKIEDIVPISFSALLGSLVSMFFALIGGLICQGRIWW
ncbi:MAG: hypothetical protein ABIJ37_07735 [Pseudomonadota bacterium]